MILNGYSLVAVFVGAVQLTLGVLVTIVALRALRRRRSAAAGGGGPDSTPSFLPLAAGVLLGVGLASWPLLYLLLASYVPQWRDVMCIQGVARIGTGSPGLSGWLPVLVAALQVTKPVLLFATGAWLVLHLADRRTRTAPLAGRALAALALAGLAAIADASAQVAYVVIPKEEPSLSVGCCLLPAATAEPVVAARAGFAPGEGRSRAPLVAVFYAASLALAVWTGRGGRRSLAAGEGVARATGAGPTLFLAALAALPVGVLFLRNVAAPAFLGPPYHACAYCLIGQAPLGVVAIVLFLLGTLATCGACVAARFADVQETRGFLPGWVASGLRWASFGWLGAALLTAVQLAIA